MKFLAVAAILGGMQMQTAKSNAQDFLDKSDFAKIFCETFSIKDGPEQSFFKDIDASTKNYRKMTALGYALPDGVWDGKQWYANPNQIITDEMSLKAFVIYFGFPLSEEISRRAVQLQKSLKFSDDILPYLDSILKLGADPRLLRNDGELTKLELNADLKIYKGLMNAQILDVKAVPKKVISNINTKLKQEYYQDGPIENYYDVRAVTNQTQRLHQITALRGTAEINSSKIGYGIGIWGSAVANVSNSKIVGGFFTVRGSGSGMNSQMVGQEIDVINSALPKTFDADKSFIGQQIVTIGKSESTAAIQIISDHVSSWKHGVLIEDKSISRGGTAIAVAQKSDMSIGLDFGNSTFTNSAIRLSNGSLIRFESKDYKKSASIYLDSEGYFNISTGASGLVLKSQDWKKKYLILDSMGNLFIEDAKLIMKSPDGSRFNISVSNEGVLKTTKVSSRP